VPELNKQAMVCMTGLLLLSASTASSSCNPAQQALPEASLGQNGGCGQLHDALIENYGD
jgi:hypothetical protein